MGGRRSPLEPGLLHQAKLRGDLGVSEEDEEFEGFRREAAVLRDKLWEALRYSQDNKKEGDKEGIYWLEKQKKKCQAMRKSVNSRAKALDPHKSLEETHKEKLKQNWQNMRERTKEYRKELEEMQLRVKNRPYLFEQVTKSDARQGAERRYRHTLQQAGLSEEFVRKKGKDATDLLEEESDIPRAPKPRGEKDNCTVQEGEPQEEQSGKEMAT